MSSKEDTCIYELEFDWRRGEVEILYALEQEIALLGNSDSL